MIRKEFAHAEGLPMNIPVLLEPTAGGYRATTQSPVSAAAEGATEAAALAALAEALRRRLPTGGKLRALRVPDAEAVREIGDRMRANPLYPEYERAIEEYRKVHNAVPDAD